MQIAQIIDNIDITSGGPSKSVSDLALNQAIQGQKVTIITANTPNPYLKVSTHPNMSLQFFSKKTFNRDLTHFLKESKFDILHGHGIWLMPVHNMVQVANSKNIPYIITPRGMLHPWALNVKKWKKRIAYLLYQKKDLKRASCLQATSAIEAQYFQKLGFNKPIAVIPNGIDLSEFNLYPKKIIEKQKFTLLFLSRVHSQKGIEILIEAWQKIAKTLRQNWQVEIAGNGDKNYINSLQKLIDKKGLSEEIKIIGPQFGEAKLATYHRADLFVLPTYSENFGIVVAEALACGLPVITTKGTPWVDLNTRNAGWWIDIGTRPLAETLSIALSLSEAERHQMGQNGRQLVEENYSIETVAIQTIELYNWILGKREIPSFVMLD